jgi:hypothetical protein
MTRGGAGANTRWVRNIPGAKPALMLVIVSSSSGTYAAV